MRIDLQVQIELRIIPGAALTGLVFSCDPGRFFGTGPH
jgi:hypothetical protein